MVEYLKRYKKPVTVSLAILGMGDMVAYMYCRDSCSYLQGTLAGFDLKYVGIVLMALLAILSLAGFSRTLRLLLASAIGGELYLVPYQIANGILCPFCMAFAALILAAFAVNYERPPTFPAGKRWLSLMGEVTLPGHVMSIPLIVFAAAGFLSFVLAFSGSVTPAYGQDSLPSYGKGQVQIRLYTDYLCEPCRAMEQDVEPLIAKIVANERARVTYIDTPIHRETAMYERYYLCSVKNATHGEVVRIRRAFFAAAEKNIRTDDGLRAFLDTAGIQTSSCDISAMLKVMNGYFREDGIKSTPTCVIVTPRGKTVYTGKNAITVILKQYAQ